MVLNLYSKDLLKFMYNLTKTDKVLNPTELSRFLREQNQEVSDRTIKRWFSYLRKHCGYFSYINYSSMGLTPVSVLLKNPNPELIKIIPYLFYAFSGFNASSLTKYIIVFSLVPVDKHDEFKSFWNSVAKKNLIEDFYSFPFNHVVDFYSPFHKVINESGDFDLSEKNMGRPNPLDLSFIMNKPINADMHKLIKHNPLIIPILIEYSRERWSSHRVWRAIKEKLGEGVWDYIRDVKCRARRKDSMGISFVQKTLKDVHSNYDQLFRALE